MGNNGLIDPKPAFSPAGPGPACCFSWPVQCPAAAPVAYKLSITAATVYILRNNRIHWQQSCLSKAAAGGCPSAPGSGVRPLPVPHQPAVPAPPQPASSFTITTHYNIVYFYTVNTSLLHHCYIIVTSLLQMGNHVVIIPLSCVMQRVSLYYYTIITYYYVIISQGPIITHYYLFQSPKLADARLATWSGLGLWAAEIYKV